MPAPIIRPLTTDDAARIKSTVTITSLSDVVLGLVKNALDAGAHRITIRNIDFVNGRCEVEDDGHGIDPSSFADEGGLLKQHWTSKSSDESAYPCGCSKYHGRSGEFLFALAAVSRLMIKTSHDIDSEQPMLAASYSKVAFRGPMGSNKPDSLPAVGTRVNVNRLFGNMPVRAKQQSLLAQGDSRNYEAVAMLHKLLSLLMAWRDPVSLRASDKDNHCLLDLKPRAISHDPSDTKHSILNHHLSLLVQAKLIDAEDKSSWVPVRASQGSIMVVGHISLNPAPSKIIQFITIGVKPIADVEGTNELYVVVNRVFANSRFGAIDEEPLPHEEIERRTADQRYKQDGFTAKTLQGRGKGVDRWPMFNFIVRHDPEACMPNPSDRDLRSEGSLSHLTDIFGRLATQWLADHRFQPRKWSSGTSEWCDQKSKPSFSIATGSSGFEGVSTAAAVAIRAVSAKLNQDSIASERAGVSSLFEQKPSHQLNKDVLKLERDNDKPYIVWVHPHTKERHLIDQRSGAVLPYIDRDTAATSGISNSKAASYSSARKKLRLEVAECSRKPCPWIQNIVDEWKNPTFATNERAITQCKHPSIESGPRLASSELRSAARTQDNHLVPDTNQLKISVDELKSACVIAQVDTKFILIQLPVIKTHYLEPGHAETTGRLVIVDQHAADERCKIEDLIRSAEDPESRQMIQLAEPITLELKSQEGPPMVFQRKRFARWGVAYDVVWEESRSGIKLLPTVVVSALMDAIAARCQREPKILKDILRDEVHNPTSAFDPGLSSLATAAPGPGRHLWLKTIATCPRGILEMLNSRACRSALMFNDHLDLQQCEELIKNLAECALPFQCAHGRPSMVPLTAQEFMVQTRHYGHDDEACGHGKNSFAATYKAWRSSAESGVKKST